MPRGARFVIDAAQLDAVVGSVRSYDAVVVLGAGASSASFPMTAQLPALLWQAVRAERQAHPTPAVSSGLPDSNAVLASTEESMREAWALLRESAEARRSFQVAFASLDSDRDPMPVHYALARLVEANRVSLVVSYNWDTCLERAYLDSFGVELPTGVLYKPHGDASRPEDPWVLPDEDGVVPDELLSRLEGLRDRPRTLLIIGHSGSDPVVTEQLIGPLEAVWPTFRVSPSASGPGALAGSADVAVRALADAVLDARQDEAWRPVGFGRGRGLVAALRGERLRPQDVEACPEFPAARRVADRLLSSSFATISGDSGSGKSITAFHAARRMNREGWRVVEPQVVAVVGDDDVDEFSRMKGPVLAVVDDAQALPLPVVAALEATVDDEHAVLLVSTEQLEPRKGEIVSAERATQHLHEWCLANLETVAPLLVRLDDRVGWAPLRERPDWRLMDAAESSSLPWVYMFVASGGERRLDGDLDRLVDTHSDGRLAVSLGAVCLGQIASEDAGVTREQLTQLLRAVDPNSEVSQDLDTLLGTLVGNRLVVESGGRFRAAHIRLANRALCDLASREERRVGESIRSLMRHTLLDEEVTVRAKLWLLQSFEHHEAFRQPAIRDSVLPQAALDTVVHQCLHAAPGQERGAALYMLRSLHWFLVRAFPSSGLGDERLEQLASRLTEWLATVTTDEVYGFRWSLELLRSLRGDLHRTVADSVDPTLLGVSLSRRGSRATADSWAHLLLEVTPGREADANEWNIWRSKFTAGVDQPAVRAWAGDSSDEVPAARLYSLIDTLAGLHTQTAVTVLDSCAHQLTQELQSDLAGAVMGFSDWVFGYMTLVAIRSPSVGAQHADTWYEPFGSADPHGDAWTTVDQTQLDRLTGRVLDLFRSVDWAQAAESLVGKRSADLIAFDYLLHWLSLLSLEMLDDLTSAISDDWFLGPASDEQAAPPGTQGRLHAIEDLLNIVAKGPRGLRRVERMLAAHGQEMLAFPPALVETFPDFAAATYRRGGLLLLPEPGPQGWVEVTRSLSALTASDVGAAKAAFRATRRRLGVCVSQQTGASLRGIAQFIEVADHLEQDLIGTLLVDVDLPAAEAFWRERLLDAPQDVVPLLLRVHQDGGAAAIPASRLLRDLDG